MERVANSEVSLEQQFSREIRVKNDIETLFAECIDGSMRTPFEYSYDYETNTMRAEDGSDIDEIFINSYMHISARAEENPELIFEKRRQGKELDELADMHSMMLGELGNTLIVVSDFPEELQERTTDYRGYNVTRKQTMLRVITRHGDKLKMRSQTLDGSDRGALESIYEYLGAEAQPGELLGQRISLDLDEFSQEAMVDLLQGQYDKSLKDQTGKTYKAGIETSSDNNHVNTYEFVRNQTDLVGLAIAESLQFTFTPEKQYQTIAALQARFDEHRTSKVILDNLSNSFISRSHTPGSLAMQVMMVEQERVMAGSSARQSGKSFSGCGTTMSSEISSASDDLGKLGYSTKSEESPSSDSDELGDRTFYCTKGHKNYRKIKNTPEKSCKTCGEDVSCGM